MTDQVNSVGIMDDDETEDPGQNLGAPDTLIDESPKSGALGAVVPGSKNDQRDRAATSRSQMEDLQTQYGNAQKQQADAYAAQKAQIDAATQRLLGLQVGPSEQEKQLRMASAVLSHRGNGIGTGEMYGAEADALQQQREAEAQKQQLIAQYAQQGNQATIGQTTAQMNSLMQRMRIQQSDINNSSNAANKNQLIDKYWTQDPNDPSKMIDHPELRAADVQQKSEEAANAAKAKAAAQASQTGMVTPEAIAWTQQFGKAPPGFSRDKFVNAALWKGVHDKNLADGVTANDWIANTQLASAQAGVIKDFESGKTAQTLDGANTAIKHLQILRPLIQQLNNTNTPAYNQIANNVAFQLGLKDSGAINNFNSARDFVAGEISKATLPGGGGEMERDKIASAVTNAKKAEDINSALDQWQELLAGKTAALRQRWESAGLEQKKPFNSMLAPDTKRALGINDAPPPAAAPLRSPYQQALIDYYKPGGGKSKGLPPPQAPQASAQGVPAPAANPIGQQ